MPRRFFGGRLDVLVHGCQRFGPYRPTSATETGMRGDENIRVAHPGTIGIESFVQGQAHAAHFGVTGQAMEFFLVFGRDGFTKGPKQVLEPGTVRDDGNFRFGTSRQPLHHVDAATDHRVARFAGFGPESIFFGEITAMSTR